MNRIAVSSSNVATVGYDADRMTLEVEFSRGAVYQYYEVPDFVYREMVTAESVGGYLNRNIKNNYRFAKM